MADLPRPPTLLILLASALAVGAAWFLPDVDPSLRDVALYLGLGVGNAAVAWDFVYRGRSDSGRRDDHPTAFRVDVGTFAFLALASFTAALYVAGRALIS